MMEPAGTPASNQLPALEAGKYMPLRTIGFLENASPQGLRGRLQDSTTAYIFSYSFEILAAREGLTIGDISFAGKNVTGYPPFTSRGTDVAFVEIFAAPAVAAPTGTASPGSLLPAG